MHHGDLTGTAWEPALYEAFADHRLRPGLDLMLRLPASAPRRIVDLGCGTGRLTALLAARFPAAAVVGIDHAPDMLAVAREAGAAGARVEWREAYLRTWEPEGPCDLVFSNAALHWLPDHAGLWPRLIAALAPGGTLAVQMPLSWSLPSHRLMRETLALGGPGGQGIGPDPLRAALARPPVADPAFYHDLLAPHFAAVDVWSTEYLQVLTGADPVLEWVRATGLRPVVESLAPTDRDTFLAVYRERLREAYPRRPDGTTLYPFRRLFMVAAGKESHAPR
ncbi:methyltransferase domain-containing protein [bacterium]|nr:methyltransferase domain-containing protein [bacterium]